MLSSSRNITYGKDQATSNANLEQLANKVQREKMKSKKKIMKTSKKDIQKLIEEAKYDIGVTADDLPLKEYLGFLENFEPYLEM